MKNEIIKTLREVYFAQANKHATNVQIMMNNPMAIHDHTNYMDAIGGELSQIAECLDKIEALDFVVSRINNE